MTHVSGPPHAGASPVKDDVILGPVFLALVLVITVDPLRGMMIRCGAPRWLATLVLVLGMYAIIIGGLMVAGIIGVARLAGCFPSTPTSCRTSWPA